MPDRKDDPRLTTELIYQSAQSEPDDDFWLEQANKLVVESVHAVRAATSSLMIGLGALQSIYLGMLSFAKFVPDISDVWVKALFLTPLLCWIASLYQCLKVVKTEDLKIYRHSPTDIRQKLGELAKQKQHHLNVAYWWLVSGFMTIFVLLAFRSKF